MTLQYLVSSTHCRASPSIQVEVPCDADTDQNGGKYLSALSPQSVKEYWSEDWQAGVRWELHMGIEKQACKILVDH